MVIRDSCSALRKQLTNAGLALDCLDPWEAWRSFKQFLQSEIEDAFDTSSVQFLATRGDQAEATLFLVRQFSQRDDGDGEDRLLGRVVIELNFDGAPFRELAPVDLWSLDFPTLAEWASAVEGLAVFQESMSRAVVGSEVYYEEG